MGRIACAVVLGLTCFLPASSADDFVRIGSWNIRHLSDTSAQNAVALAQHIQLAGINVLALQEIHDTDNDADRITNVKLDEAFRRLNENSGQDWRYVLHPEREGVTRNQHVGVAWNSDNVTMVAAPLMIEVDYGGNDEAWKRTPYAVKFKTSDQMTDFVVVSLHMKSNSGDVNGSTAAVRELEANALVEKLDNVREHFDDEDIILIGDTNARKNDEAALQAYANAGFKDLNASDSNTFRGFFNNSERFAPFDRILVPEETEFRFSEQYILRPADRRRHNQRFSDHWLIMTSVRVLSDDD